VRGATGYFLSGLEPDAIEAQDAFGRGQPKKSLRTLLNIEDRPKAVPLRVVKVG
jgi:hypothetical protein